MLYNIQKRILLNNPLLWNTRVLFVLLFTLLINLLFFGIGYIFIYTDFKSLYSYSTSTGFIYFASVIVSILSFILWVIYYSKNNGFKVFYPKSAGSIYLEWLLIFVIVFTMVSYPFSLHKGIECKTKSYVSKAEMVEAVEILNMIHILMPENKKDYFEGMMERNQPVKSDSIDSLQLSLLNYNSHGGFYISSDYEFNVGDIATVKEWLVNQDKEKVEKLINSFLELQKKHNLTTNLATDMWMSLIYIPTGYPVGDFSRIYRSNMEDSNSCYYYDSQKNNRSSTDYYVQYRELSRAYNKIMDAYMQGAGENILLWVICYAIGIALAVFSFRITSGKSWLIALVSIGVIMIIFLFVTFISESVSRGNFALYVYIILMLGLFFTELIYLLSRIYEKNANKRKTSVILNHLIWYIPVVPAMIILLIYQISDDNCANNHNYCISEWIDNHVWQIMWGNVILVFLSVWCCIRFIIVKWKSIPEE